MVFFLVKKRRYFDGLTIIKNLLTAIKTNVWIEAAANVIQMYPSNWQIQSLKGHLEVTRTTGPNGDDAKTPKHKSVTASDATNILVIVRRRRFSSITRRVMEFPANKNDKIKVKKTDSRMTWALLLDCNSVNISASCFFVEFISCRVNQFQLWS